MHLANLQITKGQYSLQREINEKKLHTIQIVPSLPPLHKFPFGLNYFKAIVYLPALDLGE